MWKYLQILKLNKTISGINILLFRYIVWTEKIAMIISIIKMLLSVFVYIILDFIWIYFEFIGEIANFESNSAFKIINKKQ